MSFTIVLTFTLCNLFFFCFAQTVFRVTCWIFIFRGVTVFTTRAHVLTIPARSRYACNELNIYLILQLETATNLTVPTFTVFYKYFLLPVFLFHYFMAGIVSHSFSFDMSGIFEQKPSSTEAI